MTRQAYDARIVAWNTAIETLQSWECDPGDENFEEEMKQAKILSEQLTRALYRWQKTVRVDP